MEDKLNQHIKQSLERPNVTRVTIELEETFGGGNNNFLEIQRVHLQDLEYAEGMLVVDYFRELPAADKSTIYAHCIEMIPKNRVNRISFDDSDVPSRLPFSSRTHTSL